jgi:hypothetical protein
MLTEERRGMVINDNFTKVERKWPCVPVPGLRGRR